MKTIVLAVLLASVAGCSLFEPTNVAALVSSSFSGRPLQRMIARYGLPDDERAAAGQTIDTWFVQRPNPFGDHEMLYCRMEAASDANGIVGEVDVSGQEWACREFEP